MPSVHILIKGKVQGVFFRATAKDKADELGIKGWVKNTKGGDVEVAANGSDVQLKKFIEWCKRGPARAKVTDVIVTSSFTIDSEEFKVLR